MTCKLQLMNHSNPKRKTWLLSPFGRRTCLARVMSYVSYKQQREKSHMVLNRLVNVQFSGPFRSVPICKPQTAIAYFQEKNTPLLIKRLAALQETVRDEFSEEES